MEEQLLLSYTNDPAEKLKLIKENVYLIVRGGRKYILKGKRKEERNILEKLRFVNEKRFYIAFSKNRFAHLNIPEFEIDEHNNLLLEYIEADRSRKTNLAEFIASYQELQRLTPEKNLILDTYNQALRAYGYRISVVTLFTLRKKAGLKKALKVLQLYYSLNRKQPAMARKYWVHGDLNDSNFFYNKEHQLYFIDFENMFYTRRWPLAEIFTKCFTYYIDDSLDFNPKLLKLYLEQLDDNSEVKHLSLYLQCRFGLLLQSIREIAQTKNEVRREKYLQFLDIALDDKMFRNWFNTNIKACMG